MRSTARRSRRAAPLAAAVLFAAVLACGDDPAHETVAPYAFEGCADDGVSCPGEAAFLCALDTLATKHNRCEHRSDCVAAKGPDPVECLQMCAHAAVNKEQEEAYLYEAKIEVKRYCTRARCTAYANCPRPMNAVVDCVDGGCAWVEGVWRLPDAGSRDASTPPPPKDASTAGPDAGSAKPPDAATIPPDAAAIPPDAQMPPDAELLAPDAEMVPPDADTVPPDADVVGVDAATEPDASSEDTGA